ncbi:MAG: putative DsbA family dithiol-disulfide isomerase [Pseudohongiellaceae bacterium]|jgi:predicted DsbA family dithiol-disulfide isomerase
MKSITFYHSIICPRCALARLHLKNLKREFPDIEINSVEVINNTEAMKSDGVKMFPALVQEGNILSGFLLTRAAIRTYLTDL